MRVDWVRFISGSASMLHRFAIILSVTLPACGGSGSDSGDTSPQPYDDLVAQAEARESQARTLGASSPCAAAAQCGALEFLAPTGVCPVRTYAAYSLVAASAAAAASAATEQVRLAAQARALRPASPAPCPASLPGTPGPACVAGGCTLAR